ncbi:DUF4440 domain-containing protein [Metabacillus sp. 113a]|uniref:nuclear transport factor 2 family protein n=1 Tax=Metabacillus sp. 113a TaxID=3404706 RepID=UPI003CED5859
MEKELSGHIKILEERLLQPETRQDILELNRLIAKEFIEITSSGMIKNKQDCLDGLEIPAMKLSEFTYRLLSEEMVQTFYRILHEGQFKITMRSSIWKKHNDTWQMTFHQGTIIKE